MALGAHRVAGEQVERGDHGWLTAQRHFGVLANQHTGLVVVGGKQAVHGAHRVGRAVQRNHLHALGLCALDGGDDGFRVAGGDQDGLGTGGNHVFHGGHLAGVVTVGLAGSGQQLGAQLLGLGGGTFLHLHKEGVGLGLGDQANHRLSSGGHAHGQGQGGKHKSGGDFFHRGLLKGVDGGQQKQWNTNLSSPPLGVFTLCAAEWVNYI